MISKILILTSLLYQVLSQECGRPVVGISFSIGGEYSQQRQWPWLAPLFLKQGDTFFCGSSVISDKHLLTGMYLHIIKRKRILEFKFSAAHCVKDKDNFERTADVMYAFLGRYDFNSQNEGFAYKADIASVNIHEEWDTSKTTFDADIAILTLKNLITFNDYIQPVCLPSSDADVFDVVGYVAGYGNVN